ncbi:MAG: hypothetical protein OXU45_04345 [Candidatus Melainabacteria bacterium]|nr:hypothetical protein [Candidatus Melainabacteria bacterium]
MTFEENIFATLGYLMTGLPALVVAILLIKKHGVFLNKNLDKKDQKPPALYL